MTEFTTVDQPAKAPVNENGDYSSRKKLPIRSRLLKQVDKAKAQRAAAPTDPKPPRTHAKKATPKKAQPARWILRRPSGDVPIADHARNEGMSPRDARVRLRAAFGKGPRAIPEDQWQRAISTPKQGDASGGKRAAKRLHRK
jgi:hypothetical protein